MAESSSALSHFDASGLNPQTCCSNCQTVFEVSLELLASKDTRVRCGECLSIFDALANLRDLGDVDDDVLIDANGNVINPEESSVRKQHTSGKPAGSLYRETSSLPNASAASLAGLANDTASLDVTYSDFDLFSANAGLPEVAYFDETQNTPRFDFDELAADSVDETFSDSLFVGDDTMDPRPAYRRPGQGVGLQGIAIDRDVGFITDKTPAEPLIFQYRDAAKPESSEETGNGTVTSAYDPVPDPRVYSGVDIHREMPEPRDYHPWVIRIALALIVLVLAGSLYAYRERATLLNSPVVRPLLEATCALLLCDVPARVDLSALKAVNRTVVSDPTRSNVLIISFGVVNDAAFGQPFPVLEIRLTDRAGRLVVTNSFGPSEYLRGWQSTDVLDPGKRLDIRLAVEDPGNTAVSFELEFRQVN